jgi:hypothetical protein
MTDHPIVTQLPLWTFQFGTRQTPMKPPDLHTLWQFPEYLPPCVTTSPTIMRCFELLSPLAWGHFPERNLERNWGRVTIPFAALAAAELIRGFDQSMTDYAQDSIVWCFQHNWLVQT